MLLDCSVEEQTYTEDCEVCCNPIEVSYRCQDDEIVWFRADRPQ